MSGWDFLGNEEPEVAATPKPKPKPTPKKERNVWDFLGVLGEGALRTPANLVGMAGDTVDMVADVVMNVAQRKGEDDPTRREVKLPGLGKSTKAANESFTRAEDRYTGGNTPRPTNKGEEYLNVVGQGIGGSFVAPAAVGAKAIAAGVAGSVAGQAIYDKTGSEEWAYLGGLAAGATPFLVKGKTPVKRGQSYPQYAELADHIVPTLEGGGTLDAPKVNPKSGATGPMQVTMETARKPGYGIKPWDGKTQADLARVGREKLAAMLHKYKGDNDKALAAYNWGEGNVDKVVRAYGKEWTNHLPEETFNYITKARRLEGRGTQEGVPPMDPAEIAKIMEDDLPPPREAPDERLVDGELTPDDDIGHPLAGVRDFIKELEDTASLKDHDIDPQEIAEHRTNLGLDDIIADHEARGVPVPEGLLDAQSRLDALYAKVSKERTPSAPIEARGSVSRIPANEGTFPDQGKRGFNSAASVANARILLNHVKSGKPLPSEKWALLREIREDANKALAANRRDHEMTPKEIADMKDNMSMLDEALQYDPENTNPRDPNPPALSPQLGDKPKGPPKPPRRSADGHPDASDDAALRRIIDTPKNKKEAARIHKEAMAKELNQKGPNGRRIKKSPEEIATLRAAADEKVAAFYAEKLADAKKHLAKALNDTEAAKTKTKTDPNADLLDRVDKAIADSRTLRAEVSATMKKGRPQDATPDGPPPPNDPPPPVDDMSPPPPEPGSAMERLVQGIEAGKKLTQKQKNMISRERSKRFTEMGKTAQYASGRRGSHAMLKKLEGEMDKVEFESLEHLFTPEEIDGFFDLINKHNRLTLGEKATAIRGLEKLLKGKNPVDSELSALAEIFPEDVFNALHNRNSKVKTFILNALGLPRSLMSSMDLSFPFRQAIGLVGTKEFWTNIPKLGRLAVSESYFKALQQKIAADPDFKMAKDAGVDFTDRGKTLSKREEAFQSSWGEKVPIMGPIVKGSTRAFVGYANALRLEAFKSLKHQAEQAGFDVKHEAGLLESLGEIVNVGTGRGSLGRFNQAAPILNSVFFSTRLMASRFQTLNPVYYKKLHPFARKKAVKQAIALATFWASTTALMYLAGFDVELDPRSTDAGKGRDGNIRHDTSGGYQTYLRTLAQFAFGQTVDSDTGKETDLKDNIFKNRWNVIENFFYNKFAPVPSFIKDVIIGKNAVGEEVKFYAANGEWDKWEKDPIVTRLIPMIAPEIKKLYKEGGIMYLPHVFPAIFGTGLQVYDKNKNKKKKTKASADWQFTTQGEDLSSVTPKDDWN